MKRSLTLAGADSLPHGPTLKSRPAGGSRIHDQMRQGLFPRAEMLLFGIASRLNSNTSGMERALSGGHAIRVHRKASEVSSSLSSEAAWEHFTAADEECFYRKQ